MGCAESREPEPGPEPEPIAPPATDDDLARHLSRTSSYGQAMTAAMIPGDNPEDVEANLLHEERKAAKRQERLQHLQSGGAADQTFDTIMGFTSGYANVEFRGSAIQTSAQGPLTVTGTADPVLVDARRPTSTPLLLDPAPVTEVCTTILAGNMGMGHGALPLLCLLHDVSLRKPCRQFPPHGYSEINKNNLISAAPSTHLQH